MALPSKAKLLRMVGEYAEYHEYKPELSGVGTWYFTDKYGREVEVGSMTIIKWWEDNRVKAKKSLS